MKRGWFGKLAAVLAAVGILMQSGGALAYSVRQSTIESEEDSRLASLHQLMENQVFSTAADREKAMAGVEYLLFDSAYAAVEGGTFPYSNSGGYVTYVDDGIYQAEVKAAGCYAYSKYASYAFQADNELYVDIWISSGAIGKIRTRDC